MSANARELASSSYLPGRRINMWAPCRKQSTPGHVWTQDARETHGVVGVSLRCIWLCCVSLRSVSLRFVSLLFLVLLRFRFVSPRFLPRLASPRLACWSRLLSVCFPCLSFPTEQGWRHFKSSNPWVGGCVYTYSTGVGLGWVGSNAKY